MNKRKLILLGGVATLTIAILFFTLIISVITAALKSLSEQNSEAVDYSEPVACSITGTRKGKDLNLKLTYDSFSVKGITGTISTSGETFSASNKKSGNGKTKLQLPTAGADLDVQTFMAYTAVTATGSAQYKLLNSGNAKDDGIYRKVGGRYAIALGSFYGSTIGTTYILIFKQKDGSAKTVKAILGDQKADAHTDAKHQYHKEDKSVVEFITAKGTSKNVTATQRQINQDFGTLTGIYRDGRTNVQLTGTIDGQSVSVTGSVDGVALTASGTLKNGKFSAEGFIGDSGGAIAENGVYSGGKFTWPVPGHTKLSCDYGPRICPFHGPETHSGIDIPAPYGTNVLAAADGTVVQAGWMGSYGNGVLISHGSAIFTLYGHNSSLLVKKGQKVKKGQPVAKVGSTGSSTGNHCHFEVRKGGSEHSYHTSPWAYLKK